MEKISVGRGMLTDGAVWLGDEGGMARLRVPEKGGGLDVTWLKERDERYLVFLWRRKRSIVCRLICWCIAAGRRAGSRCLVSGSGASADSYGDLCGSDVAGCACAFSGDLSGAAENRVSGQTGGQGGNQPDCAGSASYG